MASFAATVSALFSKIISFFMSILIMLFPNSTIDLQQQRENNINNWIPIIEEAIINKDTSLTLSFLCQSLQQKSDIAEKVQTIYDLIAGDVINITWSPSLSYSNEGISSSGYNLELKTSVNKNYKFAFGWTTVNVEHPELTKCIDISLRPISSDGNKEYILAMIAADSYDPTKTDPEWVTNIANTFRTKNTLALTNIFCDNIRKNTPDLADKISALFDFIDGDIKSIDCFLSVTWGLADNVYQTRYELSIWTTEGLYVAFVDWQDANEEQPEYIGLNGLYLLRSDANGSEQLFYTASDNSVEQKYVAEWLSE